MKINYQLKLEELLSTLTSSPKLLLHSCCAPCSSYVLEYLTNYFDITIFYYNPNIAPIEEYEKRKAEQIEFIQTVHPEIHILESDYESSQFEKISKGLETEPEGGSRCHKCYYLRMEKTAREAKKGNYDYFTTTLSVSPYKNSEVLNTIGETLEKIYSVSYLYSDFKKKDGYKRSIQLSKTYELYRQDYCGCFYSKKEEIKYEV